MSTPLILCPRCRQHTIRAADDAPCPRCARPSRSGRAAWLTAALLTFAAPAASVVAQPEPQPAPPREVEQPAYGIAPNPLDGPIDPTIATPAYGIAPIDPLPVPIPSSRAQGAAAFLLLNPDVTLTIEVHDLTKHGDARTLASQIIAQGVVPERVQVISTPASAGVTGAMSLRFTLP